jgi:GTP-binding protein
MVGEGMYSRIDEVHDKVFDLFVELNATDEQLDFPLLYASGKDGWAGKELDGPRDSIIPVLDAILEYIPSPTIQAGPVQMQIATLGYSEFVGRIGIGRIYRGTLDLKTPLTLIKNDGSSKSVKIKQLFTYVGLERKEVESVQCGDLCAIVGIEGIDIGDTITDSNAQEALPPIHLDEPTISMMFRVNNSPFYGKEGKFVSSRHLRERLFTETERDVALVVEEVDGDSFNVSGRGVLHLSILIENMRREGYEMTVSQPHVIYKTIDGVKQEPIELLDVDTPSDTAGKVIELVGTRRGEMKSMETHGNRTLLEFMVPTRGIIGLRSKIMTASAGEAIVSHLYDHYEPCKGEIINRMNGVLISMGQGEAVAYAIDALQQRGTFFIPPGTPVYEGMIVAENCKDDDLVVNMQKSKQLTNVRSSSSDKAMKIAPPRTLSLEETLEYIADDELVEITPKSIRMRKRFLTEIDRKRNKNGKL